MSFTTFDPTPLLTREQIAQQVHQVSLARGLDKTATVIALMTIATEAGANGQWWCPANLAIPASTSYRHDSLSNDARSMGYYQQQPGPNGEPWWGTTADMMTLASATNTFLARLTDDWQQAANNPTLAGEFAADVQDCAEEYRGRYAEHWDEAWDVLNRALAPDGPGEATGSAPSPQVSDTQNGGQQTVTRPAYTERQNWCANNQSRAGTPIDLWLIHTEEGDGDADSLANYLKSTQGSPNPVSYHYTISQDANGAVTVVDVVDTDLAAWAVGDANNRSINACFAGSTVNWTRADWLTRAGNAIDVAAYLAVADCHKYGINPRVITPPYASDPPGISDHRYVTQHLHWGTHTDVGDHYPWDVFTAAINKYAGLAPGQAKPPAPPSKGILMALSDQQQANVYNAIMGIAAVTADNNEQLRGPKQHGWPQLGQNDQGQDLTLVDAIAATRADLAELRTLIEGLAK